MSLLLDDVRKKRLVKQRLAGKKAASVILPQSEARKHQRAFLTEAVCLHLNMAYCTSLE